MSPLVAGVSTYAALATGLLPGMLALVLLLALLVVVPTAPDLSRRLALNGSVLLGWVPVLWWVSWPVPVDHAALAMAAVISALVWRVAGAAAPGAALRGLIPTVRRTDLLLPVSAMLALAAMWRWAFAGSPRQALETMLPGVDNAAHFAMYASILRHGVPSSSLGRAPDGSQSAFTEYPQGFHSLVATLTEVGHARLPTGTSMLTSYTHGVALVVVLGLTVLTAAVVSLPAVRDRFWVALPVVVLALAAFLWRPGQDLLADGFANFWLASLAVSVALLLCLPAQPRVSVAATVAVAGLLVAVVYGWALLAVLAGPAVLALAVPVKETLRDPARRRAAWLSVFVLALAGLLALRALAALMRDVSVSSVVAAVGGIHSPSPLPTFALLLVGVFLLPASPAMLRSRQAGADAVVAARRARVLVLTLVVGAAVSTAMLVAQLSSLGGSSYYFLKFFMGFGLVLAAVVPAVAAMVFAAGVPTGGRRGLRIGAAVVAVVVASQFFGQFPGAVVPLWDNERSGTALLRAPFSSAGLADGVLRAARGYAGRDTPNFDYVAIGDAGAPSILYPNNWFHAMLVAESSASLERSQRLLDRVKHVDDAVPPVRRLLREHRDVTVVVAPEHVSELRQKLGDPALTDRVVTW